MSAISVRAARDGFSLVELIVAIVLLGIVLMTLGGLSFRTSRMGLDVGYGDDGDWTVYVTMGTGWVRP